MFARTVGLVSRRSPISQTLPVFTRFVHSYVSSDECILKPGEVYSFTDNKDSVYDTNYCIELYNAIEKLTADDIRAAANYIFKNPPITSIVANQRTFDELKLH